MAHKARLVLTGTDVSYSFEGKPTTTKNNVAFIIPEGVISEGTYPALIEVIVGNKYLVPMKFSTVFKRSVATDTKLVETKKSEPLIECNVPLQTKKALKDKWLAKKA